MSDQPATKGRTRGTSKATQAAAGVAGALAFLGIGWTMGARTASQHASAQAATSPTTGLPATQIPGEWDDENGQWGTIQLPGAGLSPAQPGTGGIVPPTTGSGGSSVSGAGISTSSATTAGAGTATTGLTTTTGGAP